MKRALLLHLAGTPPSGGPGSRVFPSSTIGVSDLRSVASSAALAYYHAVFAAMKAHGLRPLVTLDHYTLPVWLHAPACHVDLSTCAQRGWLDPAAVGEAARYAGFVAGEFPEVDLWATLNEPFTAVVLAGYLSLHS